MMMLGIVETTMGLMTLLEMGNSFGSYVVMLMGGPYVNEVL